jgi:hypothetical protein
MIEDGVKLPNGQNLSLGAKMKNIIPEFAMKNATAGGEVTLLDVMGVRGCRGCMLSYIYYRADA